MRRFLFPLVEASPSRHFTMFVRNAGEAASGIGVEKSVLGSGVCEVVAPIADDDDPPTAYSETVKLLLTVCALLYTLLLRCLSRMNSGHTVLDRMC